MRGSMVIDNYLLGVEGCRDGAVVKGKTFVDGAPFYFCKKTGCKRARMRASKEREREEDGLAPYMQKV